MGIVQQVYEVTKELHELVDAAYEKDNRDAHIESVEALLEKRDALLEQLEPPYSREERMMGLQIVEMNEHVKVGLQRLKQEVKVDIQQLNKQKQHGQKYRNPYGNTSMDGMFLDKRN
ncbi:hypothetical protein GCM10007140_34270 [Priestia taiwanensis]|uniref:Flagellar protein FliT n=2 Tax=Priestia taiwanensis TaxID=1347902 RepID=A0A917ESJ8_9BACI|nr:hypothetical protein GCM10007140_34270 [Priestia taiwanensis]